MKMTFFPSPVSLATHLLKLCFLMSRGVFFKFLKIFVCGLKPSMSESHKGKNHLQPDTKANCECLLVADVGDHHPWQPTYVLRTKTQGS